jgi:hypothetical protein
MVAKFFNGSTYKIIVACKDSSEKNKWPHAFDD